MLLSLLICFQHKLIVCEGQKAFVSCPSIFDEITVVETMYGRKDPSICVHQSIPSSTMCQEQETQINAQIRGLCEGEHTCEVAANNDLLAKAGTTICPNVYKYLDIKFRSVWFGCGLRNTYMEKQRICANTLQGCQRIMLPQG